MAVVEETPIASSLANGVTTLFPHLFTVLDASDLVVQGTVGGVTTTYTLGVDYSVNGVGASSGSVQFFSPPASGVTVTRFRSTALERETDYQTNGDFLAQTVNRDLDRVWFALQDIYNGGNAAPSALRVPNGETVAFLPNAAARAGYFLGFDGAGQPSLLAATNGSAAALSADLSSTSDAAKGDALIGVKRTSTGTVATTLHNWIERQQLDTYADFGIAPDGTTDRTSALTSLFSALSGFRGWLRIPYNTKFNVATVYAAVPTGMMLDDESSINWGQPPTYKNKFRVMYSGDSVSDDTQQVIASGHHPALMLLNMGTAGTTSAVDRYASIAHGVGKDADGDPILGWLLQFAEEAAALKWRMSLRLQTPYAVAIANPQPWVTATIYAAGAYVTSDSGKVYRTTAGGTSGVTAPTGTGTGINDGGVLWDYVQAAINIDSTRFDWNEDGKSGQYAPAGGSVRHTMQAGTRSMYLELDDATDDFVIRDVSRSLDIFRVSTAGGLRPGMVQSMAITNNTISATGALQQVTALHVLTASGGPWDITDITLPSGQTSGTITLWFAGTNINLKNNVNIVTRTGADIASAANMMVTLYKNTPTSGAWVVMSKN